MAITRSSAEPRTPERDEKLKGKADSSDEPSESDEPVPPKKALKKAEEDAKRRLAQTAIIQGKVAESKEKMARRIQQANERNARALKRSKNISLQSKQDKTGLTEPKPSKSGSGKSAKGKNNR